MKPHTPEASEYDVLVAGTRYAGASDYHTALKYALGYIGDGETHVSVRGKINGKWKPVFTYSVEEYTL